MTPLATVLLYYLAAVNVIAFTVCGVDKFKAQHDRWRIPEKTLFLLSAIGGAAGFYLGMQCFRHKTKHLSFQIFIPLLLILWVGGLTFLQVKFALFF